MLLVIVEFQVLIMEQQSTPRHELIQGKDRAIAQSNLKVDLDKIVCHPTCQVIVEILKRNFIRYALTESTAVPEIYLTQFWETLRVTDDNQVMTIKLDQKTIKFDVRTLCAVLKLPTEKAKSGSKTTETKFSNPASLSEIIQLLRELGYDESEQPLEYKISSINRKYIPQPWLTLYSILINYIAGRETGLEKPSLGHILIFWGIVKVKSIDYAQLIWDEMVLQQTKMKPTSKIPFYRFTKLLIA